MLLPPLFRIRLAAALFILPVSPGFGEDSARTPPAPAYLNVHSFGTAADGKKDDTAAFQRALDAAGAAGSLSGTVFVPKGVYLIAGSLSVPADVTLEGEWKLPPSWSEYAGSTLLATAGQGQPDGTPFLTLGRNAGIKGLAVYYPDQMETNPPKAYPWTVAGGGLDNCSIIDCLLVNPYQAVDFGSKPSGRHYIRGL